LDYRALAKRNGLKYPYHVMRGEKIYLRGTSPRHSQKSIATSANDEKIHPIKSSHSYANTVEREPGGTALVYWSWPARGAVIGGFSSMNKGINIAGHSGEAVYAAAPGKVVYSGNGLRGYGNLIIIKHNSIFLTAYAHNSQNLVSDGEWVKSGQEIARMGNTGTSRVMLHFEIRRSGEPVNPLNYLSASTAKRAF
jgi:lipoprotein NlpD